MLAYQNRDVYVFAFGSDITQLLDQLRAANVTYTYNRDIQASCLGDTRCLAVYNVPAAVLVKLQSEANEPSLDWNVCFDFVESLGLVHKVTLNGYIAGDWREDWSIEDQLYPDDMLEWFKQKKVRVSDMFEGPVSDVYTPDGWRFGSSQCFSILDSGSISSSREDFFFTDKDMADEFHKIFAK